MTTITRIPVDPTVTVVISEGATIPEVVSYEHGQTVPVMNVAKATLKDLAAERKNGRVTTNAKKAAAELARRKLNRAAKRAAVEA